MEIVKYIKVIIPEQLGPKSAKKHIPAHVIRKKIADASAFGAISPQASPQTPPMGEASNVC